MVSPPLWWLPWGLRRQGICLQCRRVRFDPWVVKIAWRRKWLPTPVLLPGESHGQKSLVGYSPWGRKESDTTEQLTLSLVVLSIGGVLSTLLLLPAPCFCSRLFRSGSWVFLVFLYLLSRICPSCLCMPLFLAPYSFLAFCCLRRGMSRREHRSKGHEVSACLSTYLGWEEDAHVDHSGSLALPFRPWRG